MATSEDYCSKIRPTARETIIYDFRLRPFYSVSNKLMLVQGWAGPRAVWMTPQRKDQSDDRILHGSRCRFFYALHMRISFGKWRPYKVVWSTRRKKKT